VRDLAARKLHIHTSSSHESQDFNKHRHRQHLNKDTQNLEPTVSRASPSRPRDDVSRGQKTNGKEGDEEEEEEKEETSQPPFTNQAQPKRRIRLADIEREKQRSQQREE